VLLSPDIVATVFAFLVGACIGSFLNVCVARWPAGGSVISPASHCPKCARPIRAWENVPILGWLALRGRCAGCALPISPQYPLVELLVALVWAATAVAFGPTFLALRVAVFVTILLGVAITDAKHYTIPDGFTAFGFVWVLVTALAGVFVRGPHVFAGPMDALIGACTGAGAIAIAGWLGEMAFDREAMGFGDVTLMAVAGAALGPERALLTIFLGAALGVVTFAVVVVPAVRLAGARDGAEPTRMPMVPFGVFLAPGAIVALLFGDAMIGWYASRYFGG
jgi:leader peptidase (prepilin peptidase)/N-methyltransferase